MRNLKLTLSYDGSEFAGWQVQPGRATVQGELASAIGRVSGENVLPQGSGRTDAGVHALAQVASFTTTSTIPAENWMKALNHILPATIRVLQLVDAAPDFHARKSARAKTYRYRIYRGAICPPFLARQVWHYPYPLHEESMIAAANIVAGEHDFTSFAAADPERVERIAAGAAIPKGASSNRIPTTQASTSNLPTTNVRRIFSSCWTRDAAELIYTVRGSGFLHHMVRNLVGTFLLLGKGTLISDDLSRILKARNRTVAGPTAPAHGLYLVEVEY